MDSTPDFNNVDKIRQGDPQAMGAMVKAELPRVYNLCMRLCQHPQDAADLCQDAFVKAIRSLGSFRGDASLSTWLYRIALNAWKNKVRAEKRRHFRQHFSLSGNNPDSEGEQNAVELEDPTPTPDQQVEVDERHREVIDALNQLDPEEKTIIVLKDVEEMSYEEIAHIMDLNLGTVKSRLSRARDRLREAHHHIRGKLV